MKSQLIHIFGASGSGTTTLAKRLCHELNYTPMDTDDYYWFPTDPPFTRKRPREERFSLMRADIAAFGSVVLSGSLVDWGDALIPYFTLAVRIQIDPALRLERIRARERARFGSRIDPGGDMYEEHLKFMDWAASYETGGMDMRSKIKHDVWQASLPCPVITVNGGDSLDSLVMQVRTALHYI